MVRGVVFDMDGLLANSEPLHAEAWRRILPGEERFPEEFFLSIVGLDDRDFLDEMIRRGEVTGDPDEWMIRKREATLSLFRKGLVEMPGAAALARDLGERMPMAVASSSWRVLVEEAVSQLGLGDLVRAIVAKGEVSKAKPAPHAYRAAVEALGLPPEDCCAFEDSVAGAISAKAAGLWCVAVASTFSREELAVADIVVESLEEREAIDDLLGRI